MKGNFGVDMEQPTVTSGELVEQQCYARTSTATELPFEWGRANKGCVRWGTGYSGEGAVLGGLIPIGYCRVFQCFHG